jgi:hypothetical protein
MFFYAYLNSQKLQHTKQLLHIGVKNGVSFLKEKQAEDDWRTECSGKPCHGLSTYSPASHDGRPSFTSGLVHVGFLVDKVTLG